jgi:hypothetical protein
MGGNIDRYYFFYMFYLVIKMAVIYWNLMELYQF